MLARNYWNVLTKFLVKNNNNCIQALKDIGWRMLRDKLVKQKKIYNYLVKSFKSKHELAKWRTNANHNNAPNKKK